MTSIEKELLLHNTSFCMTPASYGTTSVSPIDAV